MTKKKKPISEAEKAEIERKNREYEERKAWEESLWKESIVNLEINYLDSSMGHRLFLFLVRKDGGLSVVFHFEDYEDIWNEDSDEYEIDFAVPIVIVPALVCFLRKQPINDWSEYGSIEVRCCGYGYKCDTNSEVSRIGFNRYGPIIEDRLSDMNRGLKDEMKYTPGGAVKDHFVCIFGGDDGVLVNDTELANSLDIMVIAAKSIQGDERRLELSGKIDAVCGSVDNLTNAITGYHSVDGGILGRLDDIESAIGSTASAAEDVAKQIQKRGEF